MGVPVECEHVNPENGDTIQHTTTGLAYYRPEINTPTFTDDQTHWALSNNQVLLWRSPSVEPPRPTAAEAGYRDTAYSLAQQLDSFQARLAAVQQQARFGQLDAIDAGDVGTLYDELAAARDTIARAQPSVRLASYDQTLVSAFDEAVAAAELLLRARLTEIPEARLAFVNEAADRVAASSRLQGTRTSPIAWHYPSSSDSTQRGSESTVSSGGRARPRRSTHPKRRSAHREGRNV